MNCIKFSAGRALLSLALCAGLACLTGCGAKPQTDIAPTTAATTAAPTTRPTAPAAPTLAQQEIFNSQGITVTATGLREGLLGPEISLSIRNGSESDVVVSSRSLSVNGFMLSASGLYSEVAAGKSALASLNLLSSELEEARIGTVAEVDFYLNVFDGNTYQDIAESGLITLSTSAADTHVQPVNDEGQVLLEEAGLKVVSQGLRDDILWDGCLVLFLENSSDEILTFIAEKVSVNGFMVTDSLYTELRPGTRRMDGIYLLDLEELGITDLSQVEQLEFSLRITDSQFRDVIVTEPICLNFS